MKTQQILKLLNETFKTIQIQKLRSISLKWKKLYLRSLCGTNSLKFQSLHFYLYIVSLKQSALLNYEKLLLFSSLLLTVKINLCKLSNLLIFSFYPNKSFDLLGCFLFSQDIVHIFIIYDHVYTRIYFHIYETRRIKKLYNEVATCIKSWL